MRASVILVSKASPALRQSAESFASGAERALAMSDAPNLRTFLADESFAAIALPGSAPGSAEMAMAAPSEASMFITRGTIEVESASDIPAEQDGVQVFADPQIGSFLTCGGDPALGSNTDVALKLSLAPMHARGLNGSRVALAIVDSGINIAHLRAQGLRPRLDRTNTLAPPGIISPPGAAPVGHGTMCAFDALIAAPRATLLDFPTLRSTTAGGSSMAGLLSDALSAYSFLLGRISSATWTYKGLVINNSWGMYHPSWDFPAGHPGRYSDNPGHPFNIVAGSLAAAGADILFAAGNCGAGCPSPKCMGVVTHTISGANAHASVFTIAGCDTSDARVGYSSQGPGIPGMSAQKPDITSYTHFLGSKYKGSIAPDTGTSAACPVAAGCVAAIRTKRPSKSHPPAVVFNALKATAKKPGPAGWDADLGFGIIQPDAAAASLGA
jgi:Subtilase family